MYSAITQNKVKTVLLMLGFVLFIGLLGWILAMAWQRPGLLFVVGGFAIAYAVFSYFSGAKMALALSGAEPIEKRDAPELYRTVENLAITAGLPTPAIYIIDDPAPNAFATGRDPNHAYVTVTRGLLSMMDDQELEGVIAHELSHVGNYDIRLMAVVLALVTVVSLISHFFMRMTIWGDNDNDNNNQIMVIVGLVAALIAPLIALLLQLAVSRKREYLADASGALLTRYPEGLASALEKISTYAKPMEHASTATAHLFIASPLGGGKGLGGTIAGLFSTHPPIDDRIAKLDAMEKTV